MVSVIIVSYNTQEITLKCLQCLNTSDGAKFETIVVDNDSSDGTIEAIKSQYRRVRLFANDRNLGFGMANNIGMKSAKGEYFLLLNSDAFVERDTLTKCVEFIAKHPEVGVVGCKLVYPEGSFQQSAGLFPNLGRIVSHMWFSGSGLHIKNKDFYENTHEVDWVTGSFVLLRREVFEKTGGFDERFFMYGEEVEWQKRIKDAGYKVYYLADAVAVHLGGASTKDKTKMFSGEMQGYKLWFDKYGQGWEKAILPWILKVGCLLRIVAFRIVGKPEMAKMYIEVLKSI